MPKIRPKIVVVLANLGGPDSLGAVRSFLFNIFYDRAILRLPNPLRFLLAKFISIRRSRKSQKIYSLIGGKSPILENTEAQAEALRKSLVGDYDVLVVPVMRYWHPRAKEALGILKNFKPTKVVFLPLYPQFSTTTTQSSVDEWRGVAAEWWPKTVVVNCYFDDSDFIRAHQKLIKPIVERVIPGDKVRILFSAHGLPKKIIDGGDPYQQQIEVSVGLVMKKFKNVDHAVCYQSRVGLLEWIGPSLEEELVRAARDRVGVVVVPISFVSEHSETLVELDIDYAKRAKALGVPFYERVAALGCDSLFIKCLENAVRSSLVGVLFWGQIAQGACVC